MLSLPKIKNAKATGKPYKIADGGGLTLLVRPDGGKTWRFRYRYGARENMLSFGNWPEVSLAEARDLRDAARAQLRAGTDPGAARRESRIAREVASANTFRAVAEDWIEANAAKWSAGQIERIRSSLRRDVLPALGDRPIAEITAAEVLDLIKRIEKRGVHHTATRTLQRVTAIFARGVQTLRCPTNPARELTGVVKAYRKTHRPSLPADQLPEFLRRLDEVGADPLVKAAMRLLILTACRVREVLEAKWPEISVEHALWRIPAERMKMQRPHDVPLSQQALRILEGIAPLAKGEMVFPSPMIRGQPLHGNALLLCLRRMGYEAGSITMHGFRATFSTWANERGYDPDAIELCLSHQDGNAVRRAYNRAQRLEDRTKLLQDWADFIDLQRHGAAVIPIHRKSR